MGRELAGGCCLLLMLIAAWQRVRLGKVLSGEKVGRGLLLVVADCCLAGGN